MALSGIIAPILRYFTEFEIALQAAYVTDRTIMSAKYRISVTFGQNWFTQHRMVSLRQLSVLS